MADYLELKEGELNLQDINDLVSSPDCGAISVFIGNFDKKKSKFLKNMTFFVNKGTTRNKMGDKNVVKLEYESYDTMAIKEMKKICDQIREKWSTVKNIAIYHRIIFYFS